MKTCLQERLSTQDESCQKLRDRVQVLSMECETLQTKLTSSTENVETLKQDKSSLYHGKLSNSADKTDICH